MDRLKAFTPYLSKIEDPAVKERIEEILGHIAEKYPELGMEIKWNQPMLTHHGTFIMGFSYARHHVAVAPETVTLEKFQKDLDKAQYSYTPMLFRIKWEQKVDYDLLDRMIDYNMEMKKDMDYFWRKPGDK